MKQLLRDEEVRKAGDGIVKFCLQVLQQYDLEGENALHATRGFRSICHGFASIEQQGGFGLPLDLDTSLHVLLETFIKDYMNKKRGKQNLRSISKVFSAYDSKRMVVFSH